VQPREHPASECFEEGSRPDGQGAMEQDYPPPFTDGHAVVSIPEQQYTTRDKSRTGSQNTLHSSVTHKGPLEGSLYCISEIEEDPSVPINTQCSTQDVDKYIEEDTFVPVHQNISNA